MSRRHHFHPDNWELIFHAPLSNDYEEKVNHITGVNNTTNPTFDQNNGLYVYAKSAGRCGCKWIMPQSFLNKFTTDSNNMMTALFEWTFIDISSFQMFPLRGDNTNSNNVTTAYVWGTYYKSIGTSGGSVTPTNTQITVRSMVTYNYTNLSSVQVDYDYSDSIGNASSGHSSFSATARPQNCPYIRTCNCFRSNTSGATVGWIKDIKIWIPR